MSAATLVLTLLDGQSAVRIDDVVSIVATDASGQFGLLPGHVAIVTVLEPGLFSYRVAGRSKWTYGACAGGLLSCGLDGRAGVRIVSRRFLQGAAPEALQAQLDELLQRESTLRLSTTEIRAGLEIAFLKRVQELAQTTS